LAVAALLVVLAGLRRGQATGDSLLVASNSTGREQASQIDLGSKQGPPPQPSTPPSTTAATNPATTSSAKEIHAKSGPAPKAEPPAPLPKASTANPVQATEVETKIIPYDTMTPSQQKEALDGYAKWEMKGRIRIRVSFKEAPPSAIEAIAESFKLVTSTTTVLVTCEDWSTRQLEKDIEDAVLKELPLEKWPSRLQAACSKALGERSGARADVLLTPKARLEVYRRVGEADKQEKITEGSMVHLRLWVDPSTNQWAFSVIKRENYSAVGLNSR